MQLANKKNDVAAIQKQIENINALEAKFIYLTCRERLLQRYRREGLDKVFVIGTGLGEQLIASQHYALAWHCFAELHERITEAQHDYGTQVLAQLAKASEGLAGNLVAAVTETGDWQRYQKQLQSYREALYAHVKDLAHFTEAMRLFTAQLLQECEQLLGEAPEAYCLAGLGSMSRDEMMPYSDLECVLLVQDAACRVWNEADPNFNEKGKYFKCLYQLFEFKVASLGEHSPSGFHLDKEGHPRTEERLRGTIEHLIRFNQPPAVKLNDALSYSLLNPVYIYGNNNKTLFNDYIKQLRTALQSNIPKQEISWQRAIALAQMQSNLNDFKSVYENSETTHVIDIKKHYVVLLNYFVMNLALLHSITANRISVIIEKLKLENILSEAEALAFKKALWFLQHKRIDVHIKAEKQQEEIGLQNLTPEQRAFLQLIEWGLIRPCYKSLEYFLSNLNQPWPKDFALTNMQYSLRLYNNTNTNNQLIIENAIKSLALNGVLLQVSIDTYRLNYCTLPQTLRPFFLQSLECLQYGIPENLSLAIKLLQAYPNDDGNRPSHMLSEKNWQQSLKYLLVPFNRTTLVIKTIDGDQQLPEDVVNKAFTLQGELISNQLNGRRAVHHLTYQNQAFHFKAKPEWPGMEYAVGRLYDLIIGYGTPNTALWAVLPHNDQQRAYPLLVSKTILGDTLQAVLKQHPAGVPHLDAKCYSQMVLMALLTNPEDGKSDNYIVEKFTNSEGNTVNRLISIDNDHSFVPALAKGILSTTILVKTILYCFDMMKEPIHPEVCEEFLVLDADKLLHHWLVDILKHDKACQTLFTFEQLKQLRNNKNENQQVVIPMLFHQSTIKTLYQKLIKLRKLFTHHPQINHLELLQHIEPQLAVYYEKVLIQPLLPAERFKLIAEKEYGGRMEAGAGITKTNASRTIESILGTLPSIEEIQAGIKYSAEQALNQLHMIQTQQKQLEQAKNSLLAGNFKPFKNLVINDFQEEVFRQIDIAKLSKLQQQQVFALMAETSFTLLKLKNSLVTDAELLAILKKSPGLIALDISGCINLTQTIVQEIAKYCPLLEKLNLRNLSQLNLFSIKSFFGNELNSLVFPQLRRLWLGGCVSLNNLLLRAPHLKYLELKDCNLLTRQTLFVLIKQSPHLQMIDLTNCNQITDSYLDEISSYSKNLKKIIVQGCQNIRHKEIRTLSPTLVINKLKAEFISAVESLLQQQASVVDLEYVVTTDQTEVSLLAQALRINKTLQSIDLSHNRLGDSNFFVIVEALKFNSTLMRLIARNNKLTDTSAKILLELLENNPTLSEIDLEGNNAISEELEKAIENKLQENKVRTHGELINPAKTKFGLFLSEQTAASTANNATTSLADDDEEILHNNGRTNTLS